MGDRYYCRRRNILGFFQVWWVLLLWRIWKLEMGLYAEIREYGHIGVLCDCSIVSVMDPMPAYNNKKMQNDDYHFKFKITILGDKAVGKTAFLDSISQAFGKVQYSEHSEQMSIKSVSFTEQETVYRINYWEIPSRIRNTQYTFRYSLGCTAAIYVFDVTKKQSFQNVEKWIQINQKANPPIKLLVGNKVDLYSTTKNGVQKADAVALAKKYGMEYFETCSIGDSSITPIFDYLFTAITVSIPNPPTPQSLVGKGVLLGKKLINSPKYHLALCQIATLYE